MVCRSIYNYLLSKGEFTDNFNNLDRSRVAIFKIAKKKKNELALVLSE